MPRDYARRTYLFAIATDNTHPCGTSYTHVSHNRSRYANRKAAERMASSHSDIKEVWHVTNYTQQMCEMNNADLVSHVRQTGTILFNKGE